MAHGPGKYDGHATLLREATQAKAVVIMVLDGNQGTGFSVQSEEPGLLFNLPDVLEQVAKGIREDVRRGLDG